MGTEADHNLFIFLAKVLKEPQKRVKCQEVAEKTQWTSVSVTLSKCVRDRK